MNTNKGFTLVELLIVIAIIGILSSVVIANLNSSRQGANDAKVQSQLSSIRESAELYFISNGNYGADTYSCSGGMFADTSSGMASLTNVSNYPSGSVLVCNSSGSAWAVQSTLASSTTYWCVDNQGSSKLKSTSIASTTSCA